MRKCALALVLVFLSTAGRAVNPRSDGSLAHADGYAVLADVGESPSGDHQQKPLKAQTPDVRIPGGVTGSPATPAWDWSDADRVRTRFDPKAIRERAAAHRANVGMRPPVHSQAAPSEGFRPSQQHVLDGARNPELFLPAELLDVLLQGLHSDPRMRAPARLALAKGIHEMGYTEDDFWNRLQRLSAHYLALKSRPSNTSIQRVRTADGTMASFPLDVDRCVARHGLLQSARTAFGAAKFQRFLYTAVAPEVQRSDSTQQLDPAQELLFIAKGCRQ